ncbi:hypothetical protein Cme02nite_00830 [Catellatospora methionotrophica]|uniref:Uncharacterized protein n=1 Tax=Catellatospora methionotrophica TaxID=121620 RepID=A0A8J3LB05_9ACTN|nr:hypothetical protein [Catellatospora methionotrophica]GIG11751.1 hypothetical protein Cme02nite_00830 [Catellatospora methionotrophica]
MERAPGREDTITLWRAATQAEHDVLAATGWKAWPASTPGRGFDAYAERRSAERIAQSLAATGGVGYVTSFDVQSAFVDHCLQYRRGDEGGIGYGLPEAEIPGLNEHTVGAVIEQADYRAALGSHEFASGHAQALPASWRGYLQRPAWFRRGWLPRGRYLWLYTPREGVELADAWGEDSVELHPGIAIIGGDGSREHLAVDLRHDDPPVVLVDAFGSEGWEDAIEQTPSVTHLIDLLDAGTFDFTWE